jgi:hypothetical protein
MRVNATFMCLLLLNLSVAWADEGHQHQLSEKEIGSVHFTTSCSEEVQTGFQRAIAMLHSFQYEQARSAFSQISQRDPRCAMAQWGIAMSHYHGLWHNGDLTAGREALWKARENHPQQGYFRPRTRLY